MFSFCMDVKLQIKVASASYHGKQVFVRMIKKTGEYIVSVRVRFNARPNVKKRTTAEEYVNNYYINKKMK